MLSWQTPVHSGTQSPGGRGRREGGEGGVKGCNRTRCSVRSITQDYPVRCDQGGCSFPFHTHSVWTGHSQSRLTGSAPHGQGTCCPGLVTPLGQPGHHPGPAWSPPWSPAWSPCGWASWASHNTEVISAPRGSGTPEVSLGQRTALVREHSHVWPCLADGGHSRAVLSTPVSVCVEERGRERKRERERERESGE